MASSSENRSGPNGGSKYSLLYSFSDHDIDTSTAPAFTNSNIGNESSSPNACQRRQELREESYEDFSDSGDDFGAIGSSSARPAIQGEDFAGEGGPVQFPNFAPQGPDDYGFPAASSSVQGYVNFTAASSPILLPSALPNVFTQAPQPVNPAHSTPVQALLAAGKYPSSYAKEDERC